MKEPDITNKKLSTLHIGVGLWVCDKLPTGFCEFRMNTINYKDGYHDELYCKYCGEPEERK